MKTQLDLLRSILEEELAWYTPPPKDIGDIYAHLSEELPTRKLMAWTGFLG
jgi:hypothetical protein